MINEKKLQDQINRRLSGLTASEQRRMRIRAAVNSERGYSQPMRKTLSHALSFTAIAVLLIATFAFAEYYNLFNIFGRHDERYNAVAPYATLSITEPVLVDHPDLGNASASVDSAYFDGLSLNLAYRITNGQKVTEYTPSESELGFMQKGNPDVLVADFSGNEPGIEILKAWNQAIETGIPYGYQKTAIYASDHTVTDDGIDIWLDSAFPGYNENGDYCEMREFECPLPEIIRSREELRINISVCQTTSYYWFDGTNCYWRSKCSEVGIMTAIIPHNGEIRHFSGTGMINGAICTVNAEVSPMVSVIMFRSEVPLNTFLSIAPEGTDEHDCWVEVTPVDENDNRYFPREGIPLDNRTEFTLSCSGTGTLPEKLNVYVYSMWEGINEPDIASLDSVDLKTNYHSVQN